MRSTDPIPSEDQTRQSLDRRTKAFSTAILISSLMLQRFCLPFGESQVDIVFPIGFLFAALAVWQGTLIFHRGRVTIFVLFVTWLLIGAFAQAIEPNSYTIHYSVSSFLQFILVTGFCTLSFTVPVDEYYFCRKAANILAVIAIAGISQFFIQFVGLSLFSFSSFVPKSILLESSYNVVIPTGIGSLLKSNGVFLLEPSIFSQAMAVGLILEILVARRITFLSLFAAALILSFSGTGWIIVVCFFLAVGLTQGSRGLMIAVFGTIVLVVLSTGVFFFAPNIAQLFLDRSHEIGQVGSSGYLRFVTPFQLLYKIMSENGQAWLTGIGAGVSERIDLPFYFAVNTPVKIIVEYGFPGFILYLALIFCGEKARLQKSLLWPMMALLLITGGYQEFAPVLFPVFLLICVARVDSLEIANLSETD